MGQSLKTGRRAVFDLVTAGTPNYGPMRMALYDLAPSLVVCSGKLRRGLYGAYDASLETIVIERALPYDLKKCTLVHELAHWVYDDDSRPPYGRRREREARMLTARTLVDTKRYAQAECMYDGSAYNIARELGLCEEVIRDYQCLVLPQICRARTLVRTK
ncbi:hypothetical protein BCUN_0581 [Bifidobacterium cuniculi]|uniref:IrrE N-terminal-like domain-containing protein n=3 Tax=Bifidobacterium cuniculi TaxID=1688 RepID=A0A087B4X9_9BIFI|nr:hypothetical protein BCUN_0581 [Bifidobacterium cuniculi]